MADFKDENFKKEKVQSKESKEEKPFYKRKDDIRIKNKTKQKIELAFRNSPVTIMPGELKAISRKNFESDYFKNRRKYFSVVEEV